MSRGRRLSSATAARTGSLETLEREAFGPSAREGRDGAGQAVGRRWSSSSRRRAIRALRGLFRGLRTLLVSGAQTRGAARLSASEVQDGGGRRSSDRRSLKAWTEVGEGGRLQWRGTAGFDARRAARAGLPSGASGEDVDLRSGGIEARTGRRTRSGGLMCGGPGSDSRCPRSSDRRCRRSTPSSSAAFSRERGVESSRHQGLWSRGVSAPGWRAPLLFGGVGHEGRGCGRRSSRSCWSSLRAAASSLFRVERPKPFGVEGARLGRAGGSSPGAEARGR